ncbi:hypothetical protein [Candidatus Frankia alpina]|uniref:hypothetical protein n=1 Tax=Candidatus Frankia alpina TaxID=2699483 RepID=UPI0013D0DD10|nr:hypothetical protein [Candidatus Frankia alpina]
MIELGLGHGSLPLPAALTGGSFDRQPICFGGFGPKFDLLLIASPSRSVTTTGCGLCSVAGAWIGSNTAIRQAGKSSSRISHMRHDEPVRLWTSCLPVGTLLKRFAALTRAS